MQSNRHCNSPSKCKICSEAGGVPIGHVITAEGVCSNSPLTEAIQNFPRLGDLRAMCHFLGLVFYYRSFGPGFAKIAHPLHGLTCKHHLLRSLDCEVAFRTLTSKLITLPMLMYPNFNQGITLETDASVQGLGVTLLQKQEDSTMHPIAHGSRVLTDTAWEKLQNWRPWQLFEGSHISGHTCIATVWGF